VGMFLSVPLTMTAKIALGANSSTRWIAVFLGTGQEPALASAPSTDAPGDEIQS